MVVDFVIPSSKDDLLSGTGSEAYCVEEVLTLRQIAPALQAFKSACRGNADCISLHFDSVFSVLCVQKNLDTALKEETWHCLLIGCQTYLVRLTAILDQSDLPRDDRLSHRKSTKMAIYLLCQFLELFDEGATKPAAVFTATGRGKKQKFASDSGLNMDWDFEKHEGVKMLLNFVQLSLTKLWDPPVAEEEFVSLITSCCYKLLENPTTCKNKETLTTIADIIGHMVKRYNHSLDAETEGLGDGDDANDVTSKNIKKKKLYPTIETNLKNINIEKFDLAFEMNPVFQMMSTAFDEGCARGWSLDRLRCYDGSQLLVLDPLTVVNVVEDVLPDSQSCRHPVSDVTVSSLLNACRDLILQITPRHQLPLLPLPQKVIHFLCDGDQITHSR